MATPVGDSYSAASGIAILGGRFASWLGDWAVVGDSLTDPLYDIEATRWGLALTLVPPRVVWNGGVAGDTVAGVAGRLQAIITAHPQVNNFIIRIGTNGSYTPATYQANYTSIFSILFSNGKRAIFMAIPPSTRGGSTPGVDSTFVAANSWLASQCAANPGYLRFIYDSNALGDANYNVLAGVTSDGTHENSYGMSLQGSGMTSGLAAILPSIDPRITSSSDIYPANSASDQWVQNPFMSGTGGVGSGVVPAGWRAEGFTTVNFTMSIVAADASDANQTPWMRCTVNSCNSGNMAIRTALQHPAIPADMTGVKRFDLVAEIRRVNVDQAVIGSVDLFADVANSRKGGHSFIPANTAGGIVNDRCVLRTSQARDQANSGATGTPVAIAANTLWAGIWISLATGSNGGSIDMRCVSVRGGLT